MIRAPLPPCSGLEECGPPPGLLVVQLGAERVEIVEGDGVRRAETQAADDGGLRRLRELEGEGPRSVDDGGTAPFERGEVGERGRHGSRVAADVGARACLVEDDAGRRRVASDERSLLQVERVVGDAARVERRKERLLPFGMFEEDQDVYHG